MKYICKVFTPEFKALVDKHLAQFTSFSSKWREKDILQYMWNNKNSINDYPELKEEYNELGLLVPHYTEVVLEAKEYGYQSKPRVEWKGKIEKIDDIDEIFSYKLLKPQET